MFVYENRFHNTTFTSRKSQDELDAIEKRICTGDDRPADKPFARRMRNALCGVDGCKCGDFFGQR